jgi:hypothetical protein
MTISGRLIRGRHFAASLASTPSSTLGELHARHEVLLFHGCRWTCSSCSSARRNELPSKARRTESCRRLGHWRTRRRSFAIQDGETKGWLCMVNASKQGGVANRKGRHPSASRLFLKKGSRDLMPGLVASDKQLPCKLRVSDQHTLTLEKSELNAIPVDTRHWEWPRLVAHAFRRSRPYLRGNARAISKTIAGWQVGPNTKCASLGMASAEIVGSLGLWLLNRSRPCRCATSLLTRLRSRVRLFLGWVQWDLRPVAVVSTGLCSGDGES